MADFSKIKYLSFSMKNEKKSVVKLQNCLKKILKRSTEFNCPYPNKPEISERPYMVTQAVTG